MRRNVTPLAVLVVAKPAGNIPRMVNLAENLLAQHVSVLELGRHKPGSVRYARKGKSHWILNMRLFTGRIPFQIIRQPLVLLEFLVRARIALRRLKPDYVFTFYNTAAALHRFKYRFPTRKIAWLLDFRHPFFLKLRHRILERIGESGWRHADAIVVPTRERLALHLSRRPECTTIPAFVVHNAPNAHRGQSAANLSKRGENNDIQIVYAGGVGPGYGLESIIRVVGMYPSGIHLLIVGKKRYLNGQGTQAQLVSDQRILQRTITSVPYPKNIEWRDAVPYEKLGHILSQADVGYVTYEARANLNDRFSAPGKLYDYLREGLVLLTDDGCPISTELRLVNCASMFSLPVNERSLKVAIDYLVSRRGELPAMHDRAREYFNKHLSNQRQLAPLFSFLSIGPNSSTGS